MTVTPGPDFSKLYGVRLLRAAPLQAPRPSRGWSFAAWRWLRGGWRDRSPCAPHPLQSDAVNPRRPSAGVVGLFPIETPIASETILHKQAASPGARPNRSRSSEAPFSCESAVILRFPSRLRQPPQSRFEGGACSAKPRRPFRVSEIFRFVMSASLVALCQARRGFFVLFQSTSGR